VDSSPKKWQVCQHLLGLKLSQTFMNFFILLNTKENILKFVNQTYWIQVFLSSWFV